MTHATNDDGLPAAQEPILLPDLPILDSHIHLWQRDNYFAPDLLADASSGHNVRASIYVECGMAYAENKPLEFQPVGETEFVVQQAGLAAGANHALAAGILAAADLTLGSQVAGIIDAHRDAAAGRLRGIRYRAAWDADPIAGYHEQNALQRNVLGDAAFERGAKCLQDAGLVLDLWAFHPQLQDIARLAARLPNLTVVVEHVGGPLGVGIYAGKRDEIFQQWREAIRALAEIPNICIKLSGLGISRLGFGFQENGPAKSSDDLAALWRPYMLTCVEAFGPERAIFGSNYPVDRAAASYPVLLNAYKKMLSGAGQDELAAIFAGNAKRVYNLP